jgi:hypothetical protein
MIKPMNLLTSGAGGLPPVPPPPVNTQSQGCGPVSALLHDVSGVAHKALQVGSKVAFLAL